MRFKLLLVSLLMTFGILNAQDTIKSLIISEARIDDAHSAYVEITNVGDAAINLSEFEFGKVGAWTLPYEADKANSMRLPDQMLGVNESFVIAMFWDFTEEMYLIDPDHYSERITKPDMKLLADIQIHAEELNGGPGTSDSITPHAGLMMVWGGRDCWYIEHHLSNGDSAVIDQVNGIFDEDDGTNYAQAYDAAGFTNASATTILVRKFSVKTGNLDYNTGRGNDITESEWMPIPLQIGGWEPHRKSFWTVGNHGDFNLDNTTLTSSVLDIDWENYVITVPWGVRNLDSLVMKFDYSEGLAWHYDLALVSEDSAHLSARTGDALTVWACGNDLDEATFTITLLPPTAGANIVMPLGGKNAQGIYADDVWQMWDISDGLVMDTISDVGYATRTDTLLKYMEKAPNASWEIVFDGGVERPDLVDGDILKVTAENSDVKEYYIKVDRYMPSHNAYLSAITWPDIPDYLRETNWSDDTIPDFSNKKYYYKIEVPLEVSGVPALVATTEDPNAKVVVERAAYLYGTVEDRTITFTTMAEDDSTSLIYKVQLYKKKDISATQPFTTGDPFISQFVFREHWESNFVELCNPNGIPLDMSNYMLAKGIGTPAEVLVQNTAPEDSATRYRRYVPGYKWDDPNEWAITPAMMRPDISGTNPLVQAGDVFVMATPQPSTGFNEHWLQDEIDFDFANPPFSIEYVFSHWDWENYGNELHVLAGWHNGTYILYKILNPDVKAGVKPANDPADFQVIDVWGHGDGSQWNIGGQLESQNQGWTREPQYYKGSPGYGESFGTDEESNQWIKFNEAYWTALGVGWPQNNQFIAEGIGSHYFNDITEHLSTITSRFYAISDGYSYDESILGLITGITVEEFFDNIAKGDTAQAISILSGTTGLPLTGTDVLSDQDTLMVISANLNNTTKYALSIDNIGLSDNAVLSSTEYTIEQDGATGTVAGFAFGTLLSIVAENVTAPEGATMTIHDANGAYVPMQMMNLDSVYVDVLASDKVYFEVIAANGVTKIVYQLTPDATSSDAYVISSMYGIDQNQLLIEFIPFGTTVSTFYNGLIPATGATMMLIDKAGFERANGELYSDDQLVVTAQDGTTTATYNLVMAIPDESFLAYVTSQVYTIDQNNFAITELSEKINVAITTADFLANLTPAASATLLLLHSDMTENTTGNMVVGDILEVLSGNQLRVVYYDITVGPVSVENTEAQSITVYPNPSNGVIHVTGLESGNRVQVYNTLGERIRDRVVYNSEEIISLDGQPNGFYFVVVSDDKGILGHYKLIIE